MEDEDELQIAEWDQAAADAAYRQQVSSTAVSEDIFVGSEIEFWGSESGTGPRPPPPPNSRCTFAARAAQSIWTDATDVASLSETCVLLDASGLRGRGPMPAGPGVASLCVLH